MSSLDEIRNLKEKIDQAAKKKCEAESVKSIQYKNGIIQSAVDKKKRLDIVIRNGMEKHPSLSATIVAAICVLLTASVTYMIFYRTIFPPEENEIRSYARLSDFKKAEEFVNRFLAEGKFSEKKSYKPGSYDSLYEDAEKLLADYSGASASSIIVSDSKDNEERVFKAICPMGGDAAVIYLTPSKNRFYISGIEIENNYVIK